MPPDLPPRPPLAAAKSLIELAQIYMDDGAFYTAVARLRAAADKLEEHARACDPALQPEGN